jgi:hypothetical protein
VLDLIETSRSLKDKRNENIHGVWSVVANSKTVVMRSRYEKDATGNLSWDDLSTPSISEVKQLAGDLNKNAVELNDLLTKLWDLDEDVQSSKSRSQRKTIWASARERHGLSAVAQRAGDPQILVGTSCGKSGQFCRASITALCLPVARFRAVKTGRGCGRLYPLGPISDIAPFIRPPRRALLEVQWDVEAERLGGSQIDRQLELDRGFHGKLARLCALEDAIDIGRAETDQSGHLSRTAGRRVQ